MLNEDPIRLPDTNLTLYVETDYLCKCILGRKAFNYNRYAGFTNFVRDLIIKIDELTKSCHLPEFTDHGLPHLCSLVDRICLWTTDSKIENDKYLVSRLTEEDAATLLVATLLHDIGMLSQKPEDLDDQHVEQFRKGKDAISHWVRKTHIHRLSKLTHRLFKNNEEHSHILSSPFLERCIRIAKMHSTWPWEKDFSELSDVEKALASILSIVDLLDEDLNRCDTTTLINHVQGNLKSIAHWIRHSLTFNRVMITNNVVSIKLSSLPDTSIQMSPVFSALRNHYRLCELYRNYLSIYDLNGFIMDFEPNSEIPERTNSSLKDWKSIPGIPHEKALIVHLLDTFFKLALNDIAHFSNEEISAIKLISLEQVDLTLSNSVRGMYETRSDYEEDFYAIITT